VDGEVERAPASEVGRVGVDLDRSGLGQEPVVGEVGTEEHHDVGLPHRVVAGPVTEETAHADVVGIVVLDPLLATEGVADGGEELGREA
jgi:hypothetical protein